MAAEREKDEDSHFMRAAIREARRGVGLTAPNPPVGAVIVKRGKVLGKGWHRKAGGPHAEIEAIRDAEARNGGKSARGATIYITLEPCSTKGKTPPCTQAIVAAGLGRVVFGAQDPNPDHAGKAVKILSAKGIATTGGVFEKACRKLIRPFEKLVTTGYPWLISKSALSLDGRITRPPGQSCWITGEAAREDVQTLRSRVDAILIGGNTARLDNPRLTVRGGAARRRSGYPQPWRVIMTKQKALPEDLKLLTDEWKDRTLVYRNQSLKRVLGNLGRRGCLSVLLESGGNLTGQAFAAGLVDEAIWYIAPCVLGSGVPVSDMGSPLPKAWKGADLVETEMKRVGEDFRFKGLVAR